MATGEVKVIELEDNAGLVLAVKQDISADEYYLDTLDMAARHLIADEEFEKEYQNISVYARVQPEHKTRIAVKQFKVKNIKEPSAS